MTKPDQQSVEQRVAEELGFSVERKLKDSENDHYLIRFRRPNKAWTADSAHVVLWQGLIAEREAREKAEAAVEEWRKKAGDEQRARWKWEQDCGHYKDRAEAAEAQLKTAREALEKCRAVLEAQPQPGWDKWRDADDALAALKEGER